MSSSGDPGLMAPLMLLAVPLGHLQKHAGAAWSDLLLVPAPHPRHNGAVPPVLGSLGRACLWEEGAEQHRHPHTGWTGGTWAHGRLP